MNELITKLGIDWKLLVANTVTFFIVLWVLRKWAYGPIMRALEKRQATIADSLSQAKKRMAEYDQFQQEKDQMIRQAKQEAQALVHQAEVEASTIRQAELAKTQVEAQQVLKKTTEQLARQQQQMVAAAKTDLAALVVAASKTVLAETVDAELERKLQQQAVKAVTKADS